MGVKIGEACELGIESSRVTSFYKSKWQREIALSIPSFYQWQFTRSPSDGGSDHCMVAVDERSSELCGVMGLNRRPFRLNQADLLGAELTTWIVDEKHAGKGVGAKILREIQSRYDVMIGMGISPMALPIYMRSGFRFVKSIPRYLKIYDFDTVSKYAECTHLAKKLSKQWLNIAGEQFSVGTPSREEVEMLYLAMGREFNLFSRGFDYLQWRYSEHPVFEYRQHLVRSRKSEAGNGCIVCTREEKGIEGLRILHVLDCYGDRSDMQAAGSFIDEFCRQREIHIADFYCTSTGISKFFINAGWFSVNDDECFQFPHLFHPLELRRPPTTSLVYWSREGFVEMADIGRLYITKSDADLDRPTAETYRSLRVKGT